MSDGKNLLLPFDNPRSIEVAKAIDFLSSNGGEEERGAIYTKSEVVEAILDLCGYVPSKNLTNLRILEPSFGEGDFLIPVVKRLLKSFLDFGGEPDKACKPLAHTIRAVELHEASVETTRTKLVQILVDHNMPMSVAESLVDNWLVNDDFLLTEFSNGFDLIVGNPPYVRQERIQKALLAEYKRLFTTLYDRADLYVLFYEKGLDLLSEGGVLGYICSNRWVKNKYGGPLRDKIASNFHLRLYLDLTKSDAFESEVIAYPAITIIERGDGQTTLVGTNDDASILPDLVKAIETMDFGTEPHKLQPVRDITNGKDPWLLDSPKILTALRRLETSYQSIESSGVRVGIGVASGADRVFIGDYNSLPVENGRKLRLAVANDCESTNVKWGGKGIVNPYLENGELAALDDFPLFARYLFDNEVALKKRHTAKKQPLKWYKTIDRIYPAMVGEPKLLIPDIKGEAIVSYDEGHCYPHHNLYVITSDIWNLRALQAILRSSVSLLFVAAYCVRMAGGFLRFQAQYLRRIRVPNPTTLTNTQVEALIDVAESPVQSAVDDVVFPLYGLSSEESGQIRVFADAARRRRKS